jgi:V/A-type H+-transporting ATPase subunit D
MPAGRAGRAWLRERLGTAERAAELLEAKLRVLRREQHRFGLRAQRTGAEWQAAWAEAQAWLLRAALLGGRRSIRAASTAAPAEVEVLWTAVMGVHHPRDAVVRGGERPADAASPGSSALVLAVGATRAALEAAARHAVASEALRRFDEEVLATRRRLRALQERWIPRLEAALRDVELDFEETERAEGVRLRWATGMLGSAPRDRP